jgi:DNA-binding transcriptional MerR regulator
VSVTIEARQERRFTIGEVQRELAASGYGRSATSIRRLEERGLVRPLRTPGLGLRLYSDADLEALKAAIRGEGRPLNAA